MNRKYIVYGLAAVVVLIATFFVGKSLGTSVSLGSVNSVAGSTSTTRNSAIQSITTGTTTTYSVLNTDSTDREISSAIITLFNSNAAGTTTAITINCATSTTNASINGNTNLILSMLIPSTSYSLFGSTTSNGGLYIATSSPGYTGTSTSPVTAITLAPNYPFIRNWPTNTYLNCMVTTVDSGNSFQSTMTGLISFPYERL